MIKSLHDAHKFCAFAVAVLVFPS
uniref:Uncharacterized protein n=1 Tax=Anguilla anguilla TaxID=7936 RepID=A0A0E9TL60_ANGAN